MSAHGWKLYDLDDGMSWVYMAFQASDAQLQAAHREQKRALGADPDAFDETAVIKELTCRAACGNRTVDLDEPCTPCSATGNIPGSSTDEGGARPCTVCDGRGRKPPMALWNVFQWASKRFKNPRPGHVESVSIPQEMV